MSKYLFRAQPGYKPGEDVLGKDINSDVSALEHIAKGTSRKSKFISTTPKIATAVTYLLGKVRKNKGKIADGVEDHVRTPVLLIDCDKLKEYNIATHDTEGIKPKPTNGEDVVTPEDRAFWEEQKENYGNYLNMAIKFGLSSREVLVESIIPRDCIREIPMICVDMIEALEDCEAVFPKLYEPLKDVILEKIMTDDEEFKKIIADIHFDGKLQEFYEAYYIEGNKSLKEVAMSVFGKDDAEGLLLANCSRVQIIKDIFSKFDLRSGNPLFYMLYDGVDESLKERREFVFSDVNGEPRNGLLKDYSTIISSKVQRTKGKTENYNSIYRLGDSRGIKLGFEESFDLASGISFDGDTATMVIECICKKEKGEPPKAVGKQERRVEINSQSLGGGSNSGVPNILTPNPEEPSPEEPSPGVQNIKTPNIEENKFLKELQDKVKKPEEMLLDDESDIQKRRTRIKENIKIKTRQHRKRKKHVNAVDIK